MFYPFLSVGMYRGHDNDSLPPSVGYILLTVAIGGFLIYQMFKRRK
jgi:hypothetical protein